MAVMIAPLLTSMGVSAATAATIGTVASALGTGMSLLGAFQGKQAADAQAKSTMMAADYRARSAEQEAGQERAVAQRAALEERRQGRLAGSRALALAAKSGGASDPTVVNLIGDIAGEAEYRAMGAMQQGEERARGLETGADLSRYEGRQESKAIKRKGRNDLFSSVTGTLLTSISEGASKYGESFKKSSSSGGSGSLQYAH